MRVALNDFQLGPGGAERVMSLLAGELVAGVTRCGWSTLAQTGRFLPRRFPRAPARLGLSGIDAHLDALCMRTCTGSERCAAQSCWAAPHVVLSFMARTNVAGASRLHRLPVACRRVGAVDPGSHRETLVWQGLRSLLYQRADASWSDGKYRELVPQDGCGGVIGFIVIPNPVVLSEQTSDPGEPPPSHSSSGRRLVRQRVSTY